MYESSSKLGHSYISDEETLAALQRVLKGRTFTHTLMLRHALEFLVRTSLKSPGEPIKEYRVATEVFDRKSDFDPKTDNIVRVQMHRLREKLDEFYSGEGRDEPVRIVIPRGHYNPRCIRNSSHTRSTNKDLLQVTASKAPKGRRLNLIPITIAVLVISNVFLAVGFLKNKHAMQAATLSPPLRSLWQPFLTPGNQPLIVFANPAFLVDKHGNLYRYNSANVLSMAMGTRVPISGRAAFLGDKAEDGPFYYFDCYTGSGELVGASDVVRFLTSRGQSYELERSRLASDEEILRNNVIFLGGKKEDHILGKFPFPRDLVFVAPPPDKYPIGSYIKDMNPPEGHPSTYHLQLDSTTGAIQVDYAIISLLPNVSMGHYVLVVAGLTTLGTRAAARFVTSSQDMAMLDQMREHSGAVRPHSRFFQALLQVIVRDGIPLNAKCILVRKLK